jgi:hypothetical protein
LKWNLNEDFLAWVKLCDDLKKFEDDDDEFEEENTVKKQKGSAKKKTPAKKKTAGSSLKRKYDPDRDYDEKLDAPGFYGISPPDYGNDYAEVEYLDSQTGRLMKKMKKSSTPARSKSQPVRSAIAARRNLFKPNNSDDFEDSDPKTGLPLSQTKKLKKNSQYDKYNLDHLMEDDD